MMSQLPVGIERVIRADGVVERIRLAAYAWCEMDGALLLTRISVNGPGSGLWTLPGGGLDFGEDPLDGVVREVAEETGLDVEPGELLGVRSAVLEPAETISGHRLHTVGLIYRGRIAGGVLRNEADGSSDLAAWVPVDELAELPQVDLLRWTRALVCGA
jgi:ADP-ribose pyrophosphatase YjhB (NUDIX family)